MTIFAIVRHCAAPANTTGHLFKTTENMLIRLVKGTGATILLYDGLPDPSTIEAEILEDAEGEAKLNAWREYLLAPWESNDQAPRVESRRYWTLSHAEVYDWTPVVNGSESTVRKVLSHAEGWFALETKCQTLKVWRWLEGAYPQHIADELMARLTQARASEPRWWDMKHDNSATSPVLRATMGQACAITAKAPNWTALPWVTGNIPVDGAPYLDATQPGAIDEIVAKLNALSAPEKADIRAIRLRDAVARANLIRTENGYQVSTTQVKILGQETIGFESFGWALPDQFISLDRDGKGQVQIYTNLGQQSEPELYQFTFLNITPI